MNDAFKILLGALGGAVLALPLVPDLGRGSMMGGGVGSMFSRSLDPPEKSVDGLNRHA
jgi:hypothetical protein